jgi:hypothetical protein
MIQKYFRASADMVLTFALFLVALGAFYAFCVVFSASVGGL